MRDTRSTDRRRRIRVRGFTLTELLVAVVVLLVIILAVGRIFGTASDVVKNGEAAANILQETAAIEQRMRTDLERISDEGFLLIQCVAVDNDVMIQNGGGQLLDPTLPASHVFRCDQIAFLTDDLTISRQTQSMGQFIEGVDSQGRVDYLGQTLPTPQSTASVIYYGHGIQLPFLPTSLRFPVDADWSSVSNISAGQPWFRPTPGQHPLELTRWPSGNYEPGRFNGSQPPASQWTLARQDVLLADDYDGDPDHFMSKVTGTGVYRNATDEFFGPVMESGRVDVLSSDFGRLRDTIRNFGADAPQAIANAILGYRPRAEKRPPTLDKSDVLLVGNVLASNCSNFVVDWTWSDGVGRDLDLDVEASALRPSLRGAMRGVSHTGGLRPTVGYETTPNDTMAEASGPLTWFGLGFGNPNPTVARARDWLGTSPPDGASSFYGKQVRFHAPIAYDKYSGGNDIFGPETPGGPTLPGATVLPEVLPTIEGLVDSPINGVRRYRAFFGLNGKEPFVRDVRGEVVTTASLDPALGSGRSWPLYRSDYTPWPSAIRVTATFHDPRGVIEGGRAIQFVIPLPNRVQDLPE